MRKIDEIRSDFPILERKVQGHPLVYLDSAATSLKPRAVVDALSEHLLMGASNVHRGIHYLSGFATTQFEEARRKVQKYLNAADESEIIFTRGTTDAINLVARSFGERFVKAGDEVLITEMEHHSNFVPWQMMCERTGAVLKMAKVLDDGTLDLDHFRSLLSPRTKIAAFTHASNALGTINPVRKLIEMCHDVGAAVLIDAAQSVLHTAIDVQAMDCDFLAFSGHKMLGPTGVGVLFGKRKWLEEMPPIQGGGGMIRTVTFEKTTYDTPPGRFEAGTPMIAEVIGLGAAIDYVNSIGIENIERQEAELAARAMTALADVPGIRIFGPPLEKRGPIFSFVVNKIHPEDIGSLMDLEGVAVRTGHHCTQPLMKRFGVSATVRASLAFYNNDNDITRMKDALLKALKILG